MKQYHRYRIDFEGNWPRRSAICVGVSLFLLVVRYTLLQDLTDPGGLIWQLWVPLGLGLCYLVALQGFRLNAPGIYAIWGALCCVWLLTGVIGAGNGLRSVLAVFGYILSAAVLILCAGGFMPGRLPAAICFGALLTLRVLLFDLGRISGDGWVPELVDLGLLGGLTCLPMAMVPGKKAAKPEKPAEEPDTAAE